MNPESCVVKFTVVKFLQRLNFHDEIFFDHQVLILNYEILSANISLNGSIKISSFIDPLINYYEIFGNSRTIIKFDFKKFGTSAL